jgi:hypothetical protein
MKAFRDEVLHPHILSLYENNNSYREFIEGLNQERFMIPDLEHAQVTMGMREGKKTAGLSRGWNRSVWSNLEYSQAKRMKRKIRGKKKPKKEKEKKRKGLNKISHKSPISIETTTFGWSEKIDLCASGDEK